MRLEFRYSLSRDMAILVRSWPFNRCLVAENLLMIRRDRQATWLERQLA